MAAALYDTAAMQRFARLGGSDAIVDEPTIVHCRRLLETHWLAESLFSQVNAHLAHKGLSLHDGNDRRCDADCCAELDQEPPRSARCAEASNRGNQWHFRLKADIGVDDVSGLVHHVHCTAANGANVRPVHRRLLGQCRHGVWRHSGYIGTDQREELQQIEADWLIAARPSQGRAMKNRGEGDVAAQWRKAIARLRAKVEHPFRVIKRPLG